MNCIKAADSAPATVKLTGLQEAEGSAVSLQKLFLPQPFSTGERNPRSLEKTAPAPFFLQGVPSSALSARTAVKQGKYGQKNI